MSQILKPNQYGHVDWRPPWPGITIAEDFSDWYHLTAKENNEHNVGVKFSV